MTWATSGWPVRSSDSVHPVHSWNWSQITEGFLFWTAAAICSAAEAGRPTAAAARLHTLRKSRRETELSWVGDRLSI